MPTPRLQLIAALAPVIPDGITVEAYGRTLDNPHTVTLMPYVDKVTPRRDISAMSREYEYGLVLVASTDSADPSTDDELDEALEDTLHAIDQAPGLTWTEARRSRYQDTRAAYLIAVTVHTTHTD